ncbi:MAG: hypothetical protein R3305_10115 [Gammaproteobacteria bacterium]|nr:hypothetical protein [Gammaproteobacteria bacterium]
MVRVSLSLCVVAVAGSILLLLTTVHTFNRLTDETLIAEIEFDRVADRRYLARLRTGDFCAEQVFTVFGDQWRVDAQFLKWHYWASVIGFDSQYRLERLEGRYRDVDDQNTAPTLSHGLAPPSAIDIAAFSSLPGVGYLVDATYGSSTYHDIDPSLVYLVVKSPTAIFTRTRPRTVAQPEPDALNVEVRRDCGEEQGLWPQTAGWINSAVDRLH